MKKKKKSTHLDNSMLFKNKVDIEKELFAEFNDTKIPTRVTPKLDEEVTVEPAVENKEEIFLDDIPQLDREVLNKKEEPISTPVEEVFPENKFPSGSLDDYMRNFDENKVSDNNDFFGSDAFPSIPM